MTPKTAIQKGKDLENYVAGQIAVKRIDVKAVRSHGSGNSNREKSDIFTNMQVLGRQAGIECKHYTKYSIHEWWKQTKKLESLGYEPILIVKQTHEDYDGTKVVIYLDTFLDLVKASSGEKQIVEVPAEDSREKKYAVEKLKYACNEVLRQL